MQGSSIQEGIKANLILLKHGAHSYWSFASQKCAENSVYITRF